MQLKPELDDVLGCVCQHRSGSALTVWCSSLSALIILISSWLPLPVTEAFASSMAAPPPVVKTVPFELGDDYFVFLGEVVGTFTPSQEIKVAATQEQSPSELKPLAGYKVKVREAYLIQDSSRAEFDLVTFVQSSNYESLISQTVHLYPIGTLVEVVALKSTQDGTLQVLIIRQQDPKSDDSAEVDSFDFYKSLAALRAARTNEERGQVFLRVTAHPAFKIARENRDYCRFVADHHFTGELAARMKSSCEPALNDAPICAAAGRTMYKCFFELAEATGSAQVCESLPVPREETQYKTCVESAFRTVSGEEQCKAGNLIAQRYCYLSLAKSRNDFKLCDKIPPNFVEYSREPRRDCYFHFGKLNEFRSHYPSPPNCAVGAREKVEYLLASSLTGVRLRFSKTCRDVGENYGYEMGTFIDVSSSAGNDYSTWITVYAHPSLNLIWLPHCLPHIGDFRKLIDQIELDKDFKERIEKVLPIGKRNFYTYCKGDFAWGSITIDSPATDKSLNISFNANGEVTYQNNVSGKWSKPSRKPSVSKLPVRALRFVIANGTYVEATAGEAQ